MKCVGLALWLVAVTSSAHASAATLLVQADGAVTSIEGNLAGNGVEVGDSITSSFSIDVDNLGSSTVLSIGNGEYSIYSSALFDFTFRVGEYVAFGSSQAGTITYIDNSFGADGIVISPSTLPGGPFDSERALFQFQFRGPTDLIGSQGAVNGLPLAVFDPRFFGIFANDSGANMIFGNLSISVSSSVPEPTTWVSMLLGFGLVSAAIRRTRRKGPTALAEC